MCFDVDSQPPITPLHGQSVRTEELVLSAMDGAKFKAFAAHCDSVTPSHAAIIILPDVRGLFSFYRDLAQRFAENGVEAVAIDYFGRTAGLDPRDDSFDYMPHVAQTQQQTLNMDIASAVAYLRSMPGRGPYAIFTVGFCFGGGISFSQAANQLGLAGVIGFYGSPLARREGWVGAIEQVNQFECPVLGLFGGADQGIPETMRQAFERALSDAGVEHRIVVEPDAPHSFFDRKAADFAEAADRAWTETLQFIRSHTKAVATA